MLNFSDVIRGFTTAALFAGAAILPAAEADRDSDQASSHPYEHAHMIRGVCEDMPFTFAYTEIRRDMREPSPWHVRFDGMTWDGSEMTLSPQAADYFTTMGRVDGPIVSCGTQGPSFLIIYDDRARFEEIIAKRERHLKAKCRWVSFQVEDGSLTASELLAVWKTP